MEIPRPPAASLPSQVEARATVEKLLAEEPDSTSFTKTTDLASLLVLTSQAFLEVLGVLAPLVSENVPGAARPVPALGPDEVSQLAQRQKLQEKVNEASMVLHTVRASAHHSRQKVKANYVNTNSSPITPLYAHTDECTNTTVTDSALKTVSVFNGEVADAPQQLQEFLRNINDLAQTHRLTREATCRILQRKCTSVARVLVDAFIDSIDLAADDSLLKLTLYMENKWSLSWSPSLARAQLTALSRTHQNSNQYASLQASIIRLSHLASLDQPPAQRANIVTASQLAAFTSCLSRSDQSLLLKSDAERSSQSIQPHGLASAVDFLLSHHASRNAHLQARSLFDRSDSLLNNAGTSEPAMYGGERGAAPAYRDPAPDPSRSRNRQRFSSAPPPLRRRDQSRGQSRPGGRQEDQRPDRGDRGGQQGMTRRDRTPGPPSRQPGNNKAVFHTCDSAGVPKGACIRCSSTSHLMNSPSCRFADTPLPKTPCTQSGQPGHSCRGGAHFSRYCRKDPSTRPLGNREGRDSRDARESRTMGQRSGRGGARSKRGGRSSRQQGGRNAAYLAREEEPSPLDTYFAPQ